MDQVPLIWSRKDGFESRQESDTSMENVTVPIRNSKLRRLVMIGTVMLCGNVLVLVLILVQLSLLGIVMECPRPSPEPWQAFLPEIGYKTTYFGDDNHDYSLAIDHESDDMWEEKFWVDVPSGWGYHRVSNPRQHGLPVSQVVANSTNNEEVYLATFAHQLHCLGVIRQALLSHEGRHVEYHIYHCLEKLRRGILCSADTTPEAGKLEETDYGVFFWNYNDWAQPHQCRDFDSIKGWMEQNRFDRPVS